MTGALRKPIKVLITWMGPSEGVPLRAPPLTCIQGCFPCVVNCACCLVYSSTLKMEAVHSSGTSVTSTRLNGIRQYCTQPLLWNLISSVW
jgi:hypothetical protein